MPVDPQVKSAKTCDKSLRGVRANNETPKSADPTCYNAPVETKESDMTTIKWTHHRGHRTNKGWNGEMWTATVGAIQCTITPPQKDDPLPMYWWETAGPTPKWNRRGGGSSLKIAKDAVARHIETTEDAQRRDPANQTNLTVSEVGV